MNISCCFYAMAMIAVAIGGQLVPARATAREPVSRQLFSVDDWQTVLADRDVEFRYEVRDVPRATTLSWRLLSRGRILRRGSLQLKIVEGVGRQVIQLHTPQLEAGLVWDAELRVWLEDARGERVVEAPAKPLWLYSPQAFGEVQAGLAGGEIALFDPEKDTAERFEQAKIPFRLVRSAATLLQLESDLIIIGEATQFASQRSLSEVLWQLGEKGRTVLVLRPGTGSVVTTDSEYPQLALQAVSLRRGDRIAEFDKRLDERFWNAQPISAGSLVARSSEESFSLEANEENQGWPFADLRFARSQGRIVVCSFPLIEQWESGPTPRYLLLQMLKELHPSLQ